MAENGIIPSGPRFVVPQPSGRVLSTERLLHSSQITKSEVESTVYDIRGVKRHPNERAVFTGQAQSTVEIRRGLGVGISPQGDGRTEDVYYDLLSNVFSVGGPDDSRWPIERVKIIETAWLGNGDVIAGFKYDLSGQILGPKDQQNEWKASNRPEDDRNPELFRLIESPEQTLRIPQGRLADLDVAVAAALHIDEVKGNPRDIMRMARGLRSDPSLRALCELEARSKMTPPQPRRRFLRENTPGEQFEELFKILIDRAEFSLKAGKKRSR